MVWKTQIVTLVALLYIRPPLSPFFWIAGKNGSGHLLRKNCKKKKERKKERTSNLDATSEKQVSFLNFWSDFNE